MSRLLTADELAERWQVPKTWIYEKTRKGEIPTVPLPGKYRRYSLDAIEQFEAGTNPNERSKSCGEIES
jgi:excisionase family DNA binding protein